MIPFQRLKRYFTYHRIFSSCLIVLLLTQVFSRPFIIVDYWMNTSSYLQNCENKAKPKLHCNGRCQMMKKMKSQDKSDSQTPEKRAGRSIEQVQSSKTFFTEINTSVNSTQLVSLIYIQYADDLLIGHSGSIFHPPQV